MKNIKTYIFVLAAVAAVTLLLWFVREYLDISSMGLVYVLAVILTAAAAGTKPALVSAIAGFFTWNFFFISPVFTFRIHAARDIITFLIFLIIGIIVGQITGTMKAREEEALHREREIRVLCDERRLLMEEAAQTKNRQEAERIKSVLLSSISHNLKTPLSSLKAAVGNLGQEDIELDRNGVKEQVNLMAEDIDRLADHIENLLNIVHIESGTWKPKMEIFEITELMSIALQSFTEEEYKRISINLPERLPLVSADSVQISQAIHHVVENALYYSPEGSLIIISAQADEEKVILFVDDEGCGVEENEKEKIFEKFYRGSAAVEKGTRGTGLGLAICKEIVKAHKGTVCAESSPAGGLRMILKLPAYKKE